MRRHDARSALFRSEAVAAYARGEPATAALRITTASRWALLGALALAIGLAGALTAYGKVEETSAARGVLRSADGVQPVLTAVGGALRTVSVQAGQRVEEGQVLATIDAAPLEAELQAAEQVLASVEQQWLETRKALIATHGRSVTILSNRSELLKATRTRTQQRIVRRGARVQRMNDPSLQTVLEENVREDSAEAVSRAEDELFQVMQDLASVKLQIATAYSEYRQGIAVGEQRVRDARARRDAARLVLSQTELRAPISGRVESLRAHPGQVLQPGEWIARVVQDRVPSNMTAFVPERDVAFLRAGAPARVEVDQLPAGEFGMLDAQVLRIADELADPSELSAAFGDAAPRGAHVRVELSLAESDKTRRAHALLRPGTLVTARIALRERRVLAVVFEPARRWLE